MWGVLRNVSENGLRPGVKRLAVVIVLGLMAAELARLECRVVALEARVSDEADRIEGALGAAAMASQAALEAHAARKRERAEWERVRGPIRLEPSFSGPLGTTPLWIEGIGPFTTFCAGGR